ncbi:MAG TPA: diphthine--ammonia ligase [Candidatus Nanoarchaeia archaeon]|nr:diphthine--ammonia ligase [Candidatus Nanoarchaeia archaeon]
MCGIIGIINQQNALQPLMDGLAVMQGRGRDGCGIADLSSGSILLAETLDRLQKGSSTFSNSDSLIGHLLHALVNIVPEPLFADGAVLAANCEIYNWKELCSIHKIRAENDAELLLRIINKLGIIKALEQVRGVYAFAYAKGDSVVLCRDIIGVKPLWYCHSASQNSGNLERVKSSFLFASEKKALLQALRSIDVIGRRDETKNSKVRSHHKALKAENPADCVTELNPRELLQYDINTGKVSVRSREFFTLTPQIEDERAALDSLKKSLIESVKVRIPKHKFGLLFSGGIDSLIIAKILKDLKRSFTCYVAATSANSPDIITAKRAAEELGLELITVIVKQGSVESLLKKVVPLIEDSNVIKVGVALPIFAASERAHDDGCKVIFSGSGADEVFAGYNRYKSSALSQLNKDCASDVLKIYEKNTYRDDVVTMNNTLELRVPFLDREVVSLGLRIDPGLKISGNVDDASISAADNLIDKRILRTLALELGISPILASQKKRAAQYGSGFDKAIGKLASQNEYSSKSSYLKSFYGMPNLRLGAMISSGKDGLFAAFTMKKQNYDLSCMITMKSANPDSFMFHTPNVRMAELQAKAMGIPIIVQKTAGKKEGELNDLEFALRKAKKKHKIEGVITGALYSSYQRERIEKVCDKLGLKVFSPLWHIDQEQELRSLLRQGFKIVISSIAAEGLDKGWLGRPLAQEDVDKLVLLKKEYGINVAGEGGEYESLVLDCPLFRKRIEIINAEIIEEKENVCRWVVKKAVLKG